MKMVLSLFFGLVLVAVPLFVVQADEIEAAKTTDESVQSEQASLDDAEALFAGRCAMCHQLPEPGMLKAKQWKLILVTMQQRMQQANVPVLQTQEHDMILQYLTAHARQ